MIINNKLQRKRATNGPTLSYDTIIIGGGQAGLATGYYLQQQGCGFVILDANKRIGDSWRNRWDSLRLFTPARYDGLPGMPFPAPVRLAEPEGYIRLFADLGLSMARLLQAARARNVMPDYVAKLLAACGADLALPASADQALPEPLTPREQEILALLAAGLTNREIAQQLVVSPETVKKHTGAIYSKLGVRSRTEAVARARELDLLD